MPMKLGAGMAPAKPVTFPTTDTTNAPEDAMSTKPKFVSAPTQAFTVCMPFIWNSPS